MQYHEVHNIIYDFATFKRIVKFQIMPVFELHAVGTCEMTLLLKCLFDIKFTSILY